jgi:hypothetical protein
MQSGMHADMLPRCDIYSLGLLYFHILEGGLKAVWTSKSENVLRNAAESVQRCSSLSGDLSVAICKAPKQLLPYRASDRSWKEAMPGKGGWESHVGGGRGFMGAEPELRMRGSGPIFFYLGDFDHEFQSFVYYRLPGFATKSYRGSPAPPLQSFRFFM